MPCLIIRALRFRKEALPPQMLLALTGLGCGIAGAVPMHTEMDLARFRLVGLLLYQALLLPPVIGIGLFVFPRMLGGDFGDPKTAAQSQAKLLRAIVAAVLLVGSFFIEAHGLVAVGYALRAIVAIGYLLIEVRWRPRQAGSLITGLWREW